MLTLSFAQLLAAILVGNIATDVMWSVIARMVRRNGTQ